MSLKIGFRQRWRAYADSSQIFTFLSGISYSIGEAEIRPAEFHKRWKSVVGGIIPFFFKFLLACQYIGTVDVVIRHINHAASYLKEILQKFLQGCFFFFIIFTFQERHIVLFPILYRQFHIGKGCYYGYSRCINQSFLPVTPGYFNKFIFNFKLESDNQIFFAPK